MDMWRQPVKVAELLDRWKTTLPQLQ
jgi:hypothetical protein